MGALPKTKEGLQDAGYVFDGEGRCKACGVYLEWWVTKTGHKMPMEVVAVKETDNFFAPVKEFQRIPHFASCPNASDFRKARVKEQGR